MTGPEKYAEHVRVNGFCSLFFMSHTRQPLLLSPYGLHLIEDVPEGDIEAMGAAVLAEAERRWAAGDVLTRWPPHVKKEKAPGNPKVK